MGWGSGPPKMVEGEAELEEGEAAYDDDGSMDLERDLSYLDEKVQSVLGHFQKDFEGGVSAENLGAKFGGYGSFLPTYQRSPSIWSQPKSPQRAQTHISARSPTYLRRQGTTQNATTLPDAPLSQRNGTCGGHTSHEMMVPAGDRSVKQDSFLASAQVAEKFPKRYQQAPNRSLIPNDQKPLKFRIKVGSDKTTQKNAAIYSGLGLASPSSSTGNSLGESEGNLFGSRDTPDGSLSSILQMLTSVIVAGGLLVSPLHDSFLRLTSNIPKESKPGPTVKLKHSHSATSADDSAFRLRDEDVMTRKQTEFRKSKMCKESKYGNGKAFEDDIQSRLRDSSGAQILENKQCLSFDVTDKRLSEPIANMGESSRDSAKAVETSGEYDNGALSSKREVIKATMKGRFSGNELVKDESLESMSGQSRHKFENREAKSNSLQLGKKTQTISQKGIPVDTDITESERDCKGDMDHLIPRPSKRDTSNEQDELRMPDTAKKFSSESKKNSKGAQLKGKVSLDSEQESRRAGVSAAVKEKGMKRDVYKVCDSHKDLLETNSESRSKAVDMLEDHSGNRPKESNFATVKEKTAHDRLKEKPSCKKFDNQVTSGTLPKDPPSDSLPSNMGLTLGAEQATVAPFLIEEDWVGCDSCQKWRLLPYGTKPDHLPEKWICSMLNWLPGMNSCDISEEETTKALQALSQLPLPENQPGFPIRADKSAIGVHPVDQHLINQNNQNLSFDYMDNVRKKTHKAKEKVVPVSKAKNFQQDVVNRGSSKDRKQPFVGVNDINNLSSQHLCKPEIAVKEHSDRQKKERISGGDAKMKRKVKRELDQDDREIRRRIKTDGSFDIDNFQTSISDPGRLGFSSNTISTTMASMKNNQKHSENDYLKDLKVDERNGLQTSARESKEGASDLLGGGSLDMVRRSNEKEVPSKKRKLKDWQNCQDYSDTLHSEGSHLRDRNVPVKEESNDNGFRRDKKPRVSQTDGNDSGRSKSTAELKRKDMKTRMLPSASKNIINGNFDSSKQLNKYRVKITSQLTMEDLESLKKDLGCDPVSTAATSSSSKVSDSRKTRNSYQEMKGSPVESVSSSPMRMSNMNKLSPKNDALGFDDVKVGAFSTNRSPRKFVAGDVNHLSRRSGMAKKRKNSDALKQESADNPLLDLPATDAGDKFHGECKMAKPSTLFGSSVDNNLDIWEGNSPCLTDIRSSELCKDRVGKNQHNINQRSGQTSSLPKDKEASFIGAFETVSDPPNDPGVLNSKRSLRVETETVQSNVAGCGVFKSDTKQISFDQSGIKSTKTNKNVIKESRKLLDDNREDHMQPGEKERSGMKLGDLGKKDTSVLLRHGLIHDFGAQVDKNISTQEDCKNGKSMVDCHSEVEHEVLPSASKLAPRIQNGSLLHVRSHDVSTCNDVPKLSKDLGHAIHQNEPCQTVGNSATDRSVLRDPSGPSLLRKDTSCQTTSLVLKEAEGLRGYADQLKDSGFGFECNETYFQAALKFLHGASLLENSCENNKPGELNQLQIYISTAKLCETCACEYERQQEMATAALAYKCMEVAYMRVIYCKSSSANRHWHDLQASFQNVPQGESPSSSASDIDNLNNQAVVEKAPLSKSNGNHTGNHIIAPRNRPNFVRLLDFTKDVNSAMEACKKSQNAFAAANLILEEAQNKEGIVAVKRVIDFSFQDVEEFVRLVRIAVEAISRQGFGSSRD